MGGVIDGGKKLPLRRGLKTPEGGSTSAKQRSPVQGGSHWAGVPGTYRKWKSLEAQVGPTW